MANYSGSEWVQENIRAKGQEVRISNLGKDVADLLGELFYGIYHISPKALNKSDWSNPHWIEITIGYQDFSTTDFDNLTRLVFLAHHLAIRVSIDAVARQHIRLVFHRRERFGDYSKRHPFLDEAVKRFKETVSLPEYDKEEEIKKAEDKQAHLEKGDIWCGICEDWIRKIELRRWTGDDQLHYLCPGCRADLVEPVSLEA